MTLDEAVLDVLGANPDWWLSREVLKEVIRRELYFQRSGNLPTQAQVVHRLVKQENKGTVEIDRSDGNQHLYRLRG